MSSTTRIPNKPSEFAAYMVNTDNYQLQNNRFQNWGWTGQESTDWHTFRSQSDTLYAQYADKRHRNTDIKDQLLILIKNTLRYDHDKNTGHHLLDKIALNGTVSDCETFRIKKGTLLQDTTLTRTAAPGRKEVSIAIREIKHLLHVLLVTSVEHKKRGKEKGVKEIQVYIALTLNPQTIPAQADYQYSGDASRGLFRSVLDNTSLGKCAWYIARVKNSRGELGAFSMPAWAVVS